MENPYKSHRFAVLLVLLAVLAILPRHQSTAQLIAHEGFDYPSGALVGQNGGSGFAGAWSDNLAGGVASVVAGSKTYTGLLSEGNKLRIYDTDANLFTVSRSLGTTLGQGDETVWLSFLVEKNNSNREATLNLNGLRFKAGGGTWQVATPNNNQVTTGVTWSGAHLFLVRLDFSSTGNDMAYFWVDPNLSSEPDITTATVTQSDAGFTLSSLNISHGPFGNSTQNSEWDEIRLAGTFGEAIGQVVTTNVALNKPVTVDSELNSTYVKENAVDGINIGNNSRWVSANSAWPHWIEVDLNGTFAINQLKFWTGFDGYSDPVNYKFQYWDGVAWIDILDRPTNTQAIVDETFTAVTTSKVRLYGTGGGDNYFRLYEIEVFGTPSSSNQTPMVSITSPADGASFTENDNIAITANASDTDGSISKVEFFEGANKLGEDLTAPYSFTWNSVPAGNYNLTARAMDDTGAVTTSAGVNISVTAPSGNTPPVVSITSPPDGAQFNVGANFTVTADATDPDGSITKVIFFNGPSVLSEDTMAPYEHSFTNAAADLYSFTARAFDNSGDSTISEAVVVQVNGTANAAPVVSITSPVGGDEFTEGADITITATANDSDGSVTKVEFFNGNVKLGEDSTSPYSLVWPAVSPGFYSLIVKAIDDQDEVTVGDSVNIGVFPAATGTKYYISTSGNDTLNTGLSPASPWQTIVQVNATTFAPGDFILFKRGDTFTGKVAITTSGTAGSPITFGAYGAGNKPVIDGTDHSFRSDTKAYLILDGLDITGTTRPAVEIRANNWIVRNCLIHDADDGGWGGAGIRVMNGSKNTLIENNSFFNLSGDGIYSDGSCSNIDIYDNHIGTVFDGNADNIQLRKVTGFNVVRNFMTMLGTNVQKGNFICEFSSDGYIADNICEYGNFGLNIGGDNILAERNILRFQGPASWAAGIYVQEKKDHFNVTFRYNLVHHNINGVHMFEDFDHSNFNFYNNTFYDNIDAAINIKTFISGEFKNNIVWAPNATLMRVDNVVAGETWVTDYNLIGPDFTPAGANSISADPTVVRSPFDFHLLAGSPAIDAGTNLGISTDLDDVAVPSSGPVNMGAYETIGTAGSGFPPTGPSSLAVEAPAGQTLKLTWLDNANDEYGYFVERKDTAGIWEKIATLPFNTTSFTDNTVSENLQYSYRVQAYNNHGTSLFTKTQSYFVAIDFDNIIEITAASASTSFSSNTPGKSFDNNLNTRWSKSGDPQWLQLDLGANFDIGALYIAFDKGEQRSYFFDIQVSDDGSNVATIYTNSSSGTTNRLELYDIPNVNARYVRILMHGNTQSSDNRISEVQIMNVTTPVALPAKPGTLTATAVSTTRVDLNWTDNATNETGYWVGRQLGSGSLVIVDSLAADAESYSDTSAEPFFTYRYAVIAFNADGISFSNSASVSTPQPADAAYYISSSEGNDSFDGLSPVSPIASIDKLNNTRLFPGDTVKFKAGDTWRETLIVPDNGTASEQIIFTSYGQGDLPVISGGEIVSGWTQHSANIFKADKSSGIHTKPFMAINGSAKLVRRGIIPEAQDEFFWDSADSTFYLYDTLGNPDVTGKIVQAAQRKHCLVDNGKDYIVVDGLKFRLTNSTQVLVDQGGQNWSILNNDFQYAESTGPPAGAGINMNAAHNTLIKGNVMRDMHGDGIFVLKSADVVVDSNTVYTVFLGANNGGDCIQITGTGSDRYQVINNWVTQEGTNTPKGCIQLESGNDGYVAGNTASFGAFGIEVNGNNLLVENNLCINQLQSEGDFGAGLYMADRKHFSDVTFRNNIVYGAQFNGISLDANNDGSAGEYDRSNFKFYNNTLVDCGNGFRIKRGKISGEFKNNIIFSNPRAFLYDVGKIIDGETWASDNNIMASPSPSSNKYINFGSSKLSVWWKRGANVVMSGINSGVAAGTSPSFVLLRIDFNTAGNTAYMWVNPADLSVEPGVATADATRTWTENWSIGSIELQHSSQSSHESRFDEIRVGNTFAQAISGTTGIAYEGFEYTGGGLEGKTGGFGWGTPWKVTSGNKDVVSGGSYTFAGVESNGAKGEIRGTIIRTLNNNIEQTTGSVWLGFFIWNSNSSRSSEFRIFEQGGARYGSLTEFQQGTGLDLNSKQIDPQFVDQAANDYHLASSSPAVDMGATLTFTADFEGNVRPQGNGFDAGAYESAFTNPQSDPAVSITAPADGASFTAGGDVAISASASDTDGAVTKVEFYSGFLKLGEDTTAPYNFTWSNVPGGSYTLYAVALDDDGNTKTSAGISISSTGCPGCRKAARIEEIAEVVIYPNAAVRDFNVIITALESTMSEIFITDLKGMVVKNRLIKLRKGLNTIGFQRGSMAGGIYLVHIESPFEKITKKLIVLE